MSGIVDWRGEQVVDRVLRAAAEGIDATTSAAVGHAKSNHPWRNRTGIAEGSLRMEPAIQIAPDRIRGRWGSFDVDYVIWLEVAHGGRFRFLRPAADATYLRLAGEIRSRMR